MLREQVLAWSSCLFYGLEELSMSNPLIATLPCPSAVYVGQPMAHAHRAPIPEEEPLPGDEPVPEDDPAPHPDPVVREPQEAPPVQLLRHVLH